MASLRCNSWLSKMDFKQTFKSFQYHRVINKVINDSYQKRAQILKLPYKEEPSTEHYQTVTSPEFFLTETKLVSKLNNIKNKTKNNNLQIPNLVRTERIISRSAQFH